MKLTTIQMQEMKGGALTPQLVLLYLMLAAGASGIYKILTSKSGRLSFSGFSFQWSK
ncbi:MAG: hypothetical protein IKY26_02235 [Erysipelotrichaceae bacterium]|nr:hypothetical protein [Erysipelotrichaceae bacterium]